MRFYGKKELVEFAEFEMSFNGVGVFNYVKIKCGMKRLVKKAEEYLENC